VRAWRPADAAIVLGWWFAAGVAASIIVGVDPRPTTLETFGVIVPAQSFAAFAAIGWLARRRPDWRSALAVRIAASDWVGILLGIGLSIALGLILVLVVEGFNGSLPEQEVVDVASESSGVVDAVLVVVSLLVIGPLAEELIFRGVLLRALAVRHGPRAAIWWSAAAFAALHLLDPNAALVAPLLLILGVVMGYQAIATGRLGRAYAIHFGFNLVTVVALLTAG
jgi:membrane protease YdiL (CAAX protease family)